MTGSEHRGNRNIFSISAIFIIAILFSFAMAGCEKEMSAKEVVVKFFECLYEQDYGSAIPFVTQHALESPSWTQIREDHKSGGNIWTASKVVEVPHGTNTIEMYSQDNENLRLWVINTGGQWLIDEFEYRRPATTPRNQGNNEGAAADDEEEEADANDEDDARRRLRD